MWQAVSFGASEARHLPGVISSFSRAGLGFFRSTGELAQLGLGLSGIGSVGLIAHGAYTLAKSRDREERVSAVRSLGWGIEGATRLAYFATPFAEKAGILGGSVQAGIGVYNLCRGVRQKDRRRILLGSLDLGGGLMFGASALAACNPVLLGGAIALTTCRFVVENKAKIKSTFQRIGARLRRKPRPPAQPSPSPAPAQVRAGGWPQRSM